MVPEAEPDASFATTTLEFDAVREQLARHTSFSAGHVLALELRPTPQLEEARRRQTATAEALKLPGLRPGLHLGGVHDVRPLAERARVGGVLGPEELLDVASTVRGARDRLVTRLREIMAAPPFRDVVQDPVVTQRAGRYVIPIRAESRGQVPGIVHDQSASGATLFVEPLAAVEMGNRWRTLRLDEEREVERILRALSQEVGEQADQLTGSVEGLAQIDLIRAAAALAEQHRGTAPQLVGLPRPAGHAVLKPVKARHRLRPGVVLTTA